MENASSTTPPVTSGQGQLAPQGTKVAASPSASDQQKARKRTFQELVESPTFKSQVQLALPKHLTPDRFIRVLMTATLKNPLLLECTQESMFKGIFDCAAAGLEIDGRRAHLIPFKNNNKQCYEAQLIIDYKGIVELVMRSGLVSNIHADIVCDKDVFDFDRGELKAHKIDLRQDRGEMYAVYCLVRMKDGTEKTEVMSKTDVNKIRSRSRAATSGPWVTDYNEMAKKTVFKRLSKWLPLSPEIRDVVDKEESDEGSIDIETVKKPGIGELIGAATDEQVAAAALAAGEQAESQKENKAAEQQTGQAGGASDAKPAPGATGSGGATQAAPIPDRQTTMDLLQSFMLDKGIAESAAMKLAHESKWTPKKSKALDDIDTPGLVLVLAHYRAAAAAEKKE